jgi:hypothetical protein
MQPRTPPPLPLPHGSELRACYVALLQRAFDVSSVSSRIIALSTHGPGATRPLNRQTKHGTPH